jgi:hypothetical protein
MPEETIMTEKKITKFNKLYTGMKPFKRRNLIEGQLGYIRAQIDRPIPTIHNGEIIR